MNELAMDFYVGWIDRGSKAMISGQFYFRHCYVCVCQCVMVISIRNDENGTMTKTKYTKTTR